ncbi:hypothetical protein [Pseudomonas mangiferae]|uniref:Uncharacterized protein n=1 Tax=Pseudomonas mangiferae TaxID=2593654 RepID=A0A553H069_9PSED|nr:hypothetical protein [Pseudomonas mangiferae]TRX75141.1 hypothetical protein FM069_08555 [Pseudomonas mangiferae]
MMSRALYLLALSACLLGISHIPIAHSKEKFGPTIFEGQVSRFDASQAPLFLEPLYELQYLIVSMGKNQILNHFCMVGYRWPDGHQRVAVYWPEGRTIYRWNGRRDKPDRYSRYASTLFMSPSIDLDHNVVERQEDMGMATYLRSSVGGTIADCKAHGTWYRVEPFQPPKDEDNDEEGWE